MIINLQFYRNIYILKSYIGFLCIVYFMGGVKRGSEGRTCGGRGGGEGNQTGNEEN
jgi:hypothetical protein